MAVDRRLVERRFADSDDAIPTLVREVAATADVDPFTLPPIADVVDTDALSALVDGSPGVSISFRFAGYDVTVDGSGEVVVRDPGLLETLERLRSTGTNVLVVAPPEIDPCRALNRDPFSSEGPRSTPMLSITDLSTPTRSSPYVSLQQGAQAAVVGVGETMRSGEVTPANGASVSPPITIHGVEDPADFAAIGLTVDDQLSRWAALEARPTVHLECLDELLEHTTDRRVFRLLHLLAGRIRAADARGRVHVDADRIDRTTLATLAPLFDAVVTIDRSYARAIELRE